jgi:hypothetical protein
MKIELLASAPDMAGIMQSVAAFYCGEHKEARQAPNRRIWTLHKANGAELAGVRIVKDVRNRFRFEMIA